MNEGVMVRSVVTAFSTVGFVPVGILTAQNTVFLVLFCFFSWS